MTIPTKDDALRACDELSDYAPSHPYAMSLRKTLRSYIESHTGEVLAWRMRDFGDGWIYSEKDPSKYAETVGAKVEPLFASPVQPVKLEWRENHLEFNGKLIGSYHIWPNSVSCTFMQHSLGAEYAFIDQAKQRLEEEARQWLSGGDK